jgi:hypothetical protein
MYTVSMLTTFLTGVKRFGQMLFSRVWVLRCNADHSARLAQKVRFVGSSCSLM